MRNTFHQKSSTKCVGEASPRPFYKNQNRPYVQINNLKCCQVCFFVCPCRGLPKYNKTKVQTTFINLILSSFKK